MTNEPTLEEKMARLRALSDAIFRAKAAVLKEKTPAAALALQNLQNQRRALLNLLPKPRLVWSAP
jgi:hypothetical protein